MRRSLPAPSWHPRSLRLGALGLALALAPGACGHDWDAYDPRLAGGSGAQGGQGGDGRGGEGGAGAQAGEGGTGAMGRQGGAGQGGQGGTGGGAVGCGPDGTVPLKDAFEDGVIGPAWSPAAFGSSFVAEAGGEFVVSFTDPTLARTYSGIRSQERFDLTDCQILVRVTQVPDPATHAYAQLFADTAEGYLEVLTDGGELLMKRVQGAQHTVLGSLPYDPVEHLYWRLREQSGVIYWETSPDAQVWQIQASEPDVLPLSSVEIGLAAGAYQDEPVFPGASHFDDLNLLP